MKVRSLAKRNWLRGLILIVLASGIAGAETPSAPSTPYAPPARMEWFGGYSYERLNASSGAGTNLASGWATEVQANLRGSLALVADFSGSYGTQSGVDLRQYTFLAGPRLTLRRGHAALFIHALPGAARLDAREGRSEDTANSFAAATGGGVDLRFSQRVSLRLFQADYLLTRFAGRTQNNLRITTGLVFHCGSTR